MIRKVQMKDGSSKLLLSSYLFPLFLTLVIEGMHRGGAVKAAAWMVTHPQEMLFNYMIIFALTNVLLIVPQERVYAVLASFIGAILTNLAYISYVKTDLRGEPLTLLDIALVKEAANVFEAFDITYSVPFFALALVWGLGLALMLVWLKRRPVRKLPRKRWPYVVTSLLSLSVLGYAYSLDYQALAKHKISVPADVSWNHETNGFVLATLVDSKLMNVPMPEGYSLSSVEEAYRRMAEASASRDAAAEKSEKPNVIFVLMESFWDLTKYTDLQFNQEPMPFMKMLQETALAGTIEVPGIGGGTANTEYEVLTGGSRHFIENYSVPYNPYNSYIHRPIHSLARIFREKGYAASGFHSYHGWFYRRSEVYKHLGFDSFTALEHFGEKPETQGIFAKDRELYQYVIQQIHRTPEPDFISAVTVQGHGPYADLHLEEKKIELLTPLSEKAHAVIENYANLMRGVDDGVRELIRHFEQHAEPTVIVFYSDHIPPFGSEVYRELGIPVNGTNGKRVPALIWSNAVPLRGDFAMQANLLGAYVLDLIGVQDDPFMNYLNRYREITPYIEKEANPEMYRDLALLHYDMMHGSQYVWEVAGKPDSGGDYVLGEDLRVDQVRLIQRKNMYLLDVSGSGFTWKSELELNRKRLKTMYVDRSRITAMIPIEQAGTEREAELIVGVRDSKKKRVKQSEPYRFEMEKHTLHFGEDGGRWEEIDLDQRLDWEFFAARKNIDIVRVNLQLQQTPLYFVENGEQVLLNDDADEMAKEHTSDIYSNGYLYLSIPRKESQWKGRPSAEEIQAYFASNPYTLYFTK